MNLLHPLFAIGLAACLIASPARAGDGHDHGVASPAAAAAALPRFAAASETFELVGVLNGRQLTLYLDRSDDNSPVRGAEIELEVGGTKLEAEPHGDAEYGLVLAAVPPPGVLPITATVTAGSETDLLAGELDLHGAAPDGEAAPQPVWERYAVQAGGALLALLLLLWGTRRVIAGRRQRAGGAA